MSTFPNIKRIEVLAARDKSGRRVWLLDAVADDHDGESRIIMSDHYEKAGAIVAALEWECSGVPVTWPEDSSR